MIDVEVQTDRIEGGNTFHLISTILLTSSKPYALHHYPKPLDLLLINYI